jgi:hypothetical protein
MIGVTMGEERRVLPPPEFRTWELSEQRKSLDSMMVAAPVPVADLNLPSADVGSVEMDATASDAPFGVPDNGAPVDFNG